MQYTEKTDESKRIIFVRISGNINKKKIALLGSEIRVRASKENYRILFDFLKTKSYVTLLEVYNWILNCYDRIDQSLKYVPTAHLVGDEDEAFQKFLETTFRSKGANIRLFKDESAAVKWLESQHPE